MNCKKCGKKMPDGARFCTGCGAEHDSHGNLIVKSNAVDYNKTVMSTDLPNNQGSGSKIDYNKTMMANDVPRNKVDYNKTMMANDVPHNKIDYNKTMMANDIPSPNNNSFNRNNQNFPNQNKNTNIKSNKGKSSPILVIVAVFIVVFALFSTVIMPSLKKSKKQVKPIENETIETTIPQNIVEDASFEDGYWTNDAEYFYRNGTMQKNKWIGDYYVGSDGRKVRNQLIDDTYYVDANGMKVKNEWYKFNKNVGGVNVMVWYYLGEDGAKLKDTLTPDGYYVDKDGIYIPGKEYLSPDSKNYVPKDN